MEQRTEELAQLSAGKTAVDDLGGNALLWSLAVVAYQTLHTLRQHLLSGSWWTAQPKRLRLWLLRLPAKLTTHGRKNCLQFLRDEPLGLRVLAASRGLNPRHPAPWRPPETSGRATLHAGRTRDHGSRVSGGIPPCRCSAFVGLKSPHCSTAVTFKA